MDFLANLGSICHEALCLPWFGAVATAVGQNPALAGSLAQLLAPVFQAAARLQQLPAEQRGSWRADRLRDVALALSTEALAEGLAAYLAPAEGCISPKALQVLQSVCQLLVAAPGCNAAETGHNTALIAACWRLVRASCVALIGTQRLRGGYWQDASARQASQLLLPLLQHLPPVLLWLEQAATATSHGTLAADASDAWLGCSQAMLVVAELAHSSGLPGGTACPVSKAADVLSWHTVASAMLRSLPVLADMSQRQPGQLAADLQLYGVTLVTFVNNSFANLATAFCTDCSTSVAGSLADLSTAIYQLHSTVCRALHFGKAWLVGAVDQLLGAACSLMLAAVSLRTAAQAAQNPSVPPLHLQSMSAAHSEALRVEVGPSSPDTVQRMAWQRVWDTQDAVCRDHLVGSLVVALTTCPEIAAFRPELPPLLGSLSNELLQVSGRVPALLSATFSSSSLA